MKAKRILAILAVIFLLSVIGINFYAAFTATPESNALFQASLYSMVVIPIMIFAYIFVYRLVKRNDEEKNTENKDQTDKKS
ncbi:MAG: Group-specific protein [Lachnoclostridium sp.]